MALREVVRIGLEDEAAQRVERGPSRPSPPKDTLAKPHRHSSLFVYKPQPSGAALQFVFAFVEHTQSGQGELARCYGLSAPHDAFTADSNASSRLPRLQAKSTWLASQVLSPKHSRVSAVDTTASLYGIPRKGIQSLNVQPISSERTLQILQVRRDSKRELAPQHSVLKVEVAPPSTVCRDKVAERIRARYQKLAKEIDDIRQNREMRALTIAATSKKVTPRTPRV